MSSEKVDHTHILDYHTSPASLRQRVKDIQSTFSPKTAHIVNDYVNMKLNPTVGVYQTTYDNRLRGIHGVQSNLFETNTDINNDRSEIGKRLEQYVEAINDEKEIEKEYKQKIDALAKAGSGSAGLRKNMTDSYKLQYASNFFMGLGILMASIMLYVIFAKKIISGEVSIQPTLL
jgi:hypothetical protein